MPWINGNRCERERVRIWYCGIFYLVQIFPPLFAYIFRYTLYVTSCHAQSVRTHTFTSTWISIGIGVRCNVMLILLYWHLSIEFTQHIYIHWCIHIYVDVFGVRRAWAIHLHRSVNTLVLSYILRIGSTLYTWKFFLRIFTMEKKKDFSFCSKTEWFKTKTNVMLSNQLNWWANTNIFSSNRQREIFFSVF